MDVYDVYVHAYVDVDVDVDACLRVCEYVPACVWVCVDCVLCVMVPVISSHVMPCHVIHLISSL